MYDMIIIGAGYAGLSAAALLARQGRRVLVLEKAAGLGGRAGYFERDGYTWEYGRHSFRLAQDGFAAQVCAQLGKRLEFVPPGKHDSYLYAEGRLYPRPESAASFLMTPLLPLRSRLNFIRFYLKLLKQDPIDWYDTTLLEMYRAWFDDAHVERFLKFVGFTVMIPDPARVSAGEVIAFLKRAAKAPVKQGELIGGTKQIINLLRDMILESSGDIHTSEAVVEIVVKGGRATGVRTTGAEYRANAVVFAAPIGKLFTLIDESHFDSDFVNRAKHVQSSSGLSIDFVTEQPLAPITGSILGLDVPFWARFQTNTDPTLAPAGRHVSTWAMLFEPGVEINEAVAASTEARIKEIVKQLFPSALAKVVHERKLVCPVINGNILIPGQSYPRRTPIACPRVRNLYCIGDTTQAEGCSGDIAFASALRLSRILTPECRLLRAE